MGLCGKSSSNETEDAGARAKSLQIDSQLKKDKQRYESEVKLLLLGPGESGKSTIFKQMKIIHQDGYTKEERVMFKEVIFSNTLASMKALIDARMQFNISLSSEDNVIFEQAILDAKTSNVVFTEEIATAIASLWKDPGIQTCYQRRAQFQLNDSASYYFEEVKRLAERNYVPTTQDVLRSRIKTTGIVETEFVFGGLRFRMVDVGGQRNERRKWIHCFQGVTAIIFVVAISDFDQKLAEDGVTNRMKESLQLFDEICNSKWFVNTSVILFLNKSDLFKEKIQKVDLRVCFPDYSGGANYDTAAKFITKKFTALNRAQGKDMYPHLTCATDTNNIRFVFNAVKDIILQANLSSAGVV